MTDIGMWRVPRIGSDRRARGIVTNAFARGRREDCWPRDEEREWPT